MENLLQYKVQVYSLNGVTLKFEVEKCFKNDLEAITEVYKEYAQKEFNIYIFRKMKTKYQWIKVAKIY